MQYVRRQLAIVFDPETVHNNCKSEADALSGADDVTKRATYIVCTQSEIVKLFLGDDAA